MNETTSSPDLGILKPFQHVLHPYMSLYDATHILGIMPGCKTALTLFQVLTGINMHKRRHLSKELCRLDMTILLYMNVTVSGVNASYSPLCLHQHYFMEWVKRRNIHFS